eukprot:319803_1
MNGIYIDLDAVRSKLGEFADERYSNGEKNTYFIHQLQRAINSFTRQERRNKCWDSTSHIVQQIKNKLRKTVPREFENLLYTAINSVINSQRTQTSRFRSPRRTNENNNHSPAFNPMDIYKTLDIELQYFIDTVAILFQSNNENKFTFKSAIIFGLIAYGFEIIISKPQQTSIKNQLIKLKIATNTGGGEFLLLSTWKSFLFELISKHQKTINDAIMVKIQKKNKSKNVNKNKNGNKNKNVNKNENESEKKEKEIVDLSIHAVPSDNFYRNWKGLTVLDWRMLSQLSKPIFAKRGELIDERIEQIISTDFGGGLIQVKRNGNCIIYCVLMKIHNCIDLEYFIGDIEEFAIFERNDLFQYITNNKEKEIFKKFDIENITSIEFSANNRILETAHILALHHMNEINIIIFEYNENFDSNCYKIFHNKNYTETLYMEMSQRPTAHCNYIQMPEEFEFPFLNDAPVQFIAAKPRIHSEFKEELMYFDLQKNIQGVIRGYIPMQIKNIFGDKSKRLIEIYGLSSLENIIEKYACTSNHFKNMSFEMIVNQIADKLVN